MSYSEVLWPIFIFQKGKWDFPKAQRFPGQSLDSHTHICMPGWEVFGDNYLFLFPHILLTRYCCFTEEVVQGLFSKVMSYFTAQVWPFYWAQTGLDASLNSVHRCAWQIVCMEVGGQLHGLGFLLVSLWVFWESNICWIMMLAWPWPP